MKINSHLTRQMDLIPETCLTMPITILGAGAIGSMLSLQLAKMGFLKIRVYDFDKIEVENMNSQFYRFSDIGKPKVDALKGLIKDFTGTDIDARNIPYDNSQFEGIVVSAVDSMQVRKEIWEKHTTSTSTKLFIDSRMGAETALLYAMNPMNAKDVEDYPKTLYSDKDAVQERCTAKSTMYTTCLLSGMAAKTIKDYVVTGGKQYPRVTMWSIKDNDYMSFNKEEKKK